MKKTFLTLIMCMIAMTISAHGGNSYEHSDFFKGMKPSDKAAILMVHFGTTHADTRAKTIDALNARVKKEFPDIDVKEAYTSRIVIKKLEKDNIVKLNPLQALKQLQADGYTHILIQPSTIIDGVEMESLNKNVDELKGSFKDIRIGDPLLYSPEDYEKVIEVLIKDNDKNTAYVWVGHGTYDATTAQYAMLDYMLKDKGYNNCFVGTVEGYPEFDNVLSLLRSSPFKKVVLVPFMFVAGEHAKNDIAGDWKNDLEKEGYKVNVLMEGLGQNPHIQELYISHLKFITKHRKIGIMEKKNIYETTGEKAKHTH